MSNNSFVKLEFNDKFPLEDIYKNLYDSVKENTDTDQKINLYIETFNSIIGWNKPEAEPVDVLKFALTLKNRVMKNLNLEKGVPDVDVMALSLSLKILSDNPMNNEGQCRILNHFLTNKLTLKEFNKLEIDFLELINYDVSYNE